MKNIVLLTVFLGLLTLVVKCNNIASSSDDVQKKISFTVSNDTLGGEATIYLKVNEILTDSMLLEDLDFEINLLEQLNDTLWKYTYSFGADKSHSMHMSRQILLQEWDNKIHLPYIGSYQYYTSSTNSKDNHESIFNEKITLDLSDTLNPNIKMSFYRKIITDGEGSLDSSSAIVYLNYNTEKRIFYSSIDTLNGIYEVLPEEPKKRKGESGEDIAITNEVVFTLKIEKLYSIYFIYYKNNWFIAQDFPYHTSLIPFFPMEN